MAIGYLLACYVNRDTGVPQEGHGSVKHVVLVSLNPNMPVVLEFQDDGLFKHEDCAPASLSSFLLLNKIPNDVRKIEELAHTGFGGTNFPGLIVAAEYYGCKAESKGGNPPAGYIMNPLMDKIQPISAFAAYAAHSQHGYLTITSPAIVVKPQPPTPKPTSTSMEEDNSMYLFNTGATGIWCLYFGKYFHITPDDLAAFEFFSAKPIQTIGAQGHASLVLKYGS